MMGNFKKLIIVKIILERTVVEKRSTVRLGLKLRITEE